MSEPASARILLSPSRLRRRLLLAVAFCQGALALVFFRPGLTGTAPAEMTALQSTLPSTLQLALPALLCLLAMAVALLAALRPREPACLILVPFEPPLSSRLSAELSAPLSVQDAVDRRAPALRALTGRLRAWRPAARLAAAPATLTLAGARAVHLGETRIVLRAGGHCVAIWRDATDRDTFRRLAARERWRLGD